MGTGPYPQGLKEIQIGLPCSGNMTSTRLQPGHQGFGLTSVETSSVVSRVIALGLSFLTGQYMLVSKGFSGSDIQ